MLKGLISAALGLFVGLYAAFVGTGGGVAILIFLLQYWKLIDSITMIAGTMLLLSSLPIGIFGLYEYYIRKEINFYIGGMIILGFMFGAFAGSKLTFYVNDSLGEKRGDKMKNGITAAIYGVLSLLYIRLTIYGSPSG
jgi:uncharacterized membrane protein YfcA